MNDARARHRRLAMALARHAMRVMPMVNSSWAQAMHNEVHHIEDDGPALAWAAGCMIASYAESFRVIVRGRMVRWLLVFVIAGQAASSIFSAALPLAWHMNALGIANFLGHFTPGDDYRRFLPLMDATPTWMPGLRLIAAILYLISAWCVLTKKNRGGWCIFTVALVLDLVGWRIEKSVPAYDQLFSPGHLGAENVLYVVLVLAGAALWRIANPITTSH